MIRAVGSVDVPTDIVEQVRQKAIGAFQKKAHEIWSRNQANKLFLHSSYELEQATAVAAATLLMRNQGDPRPDVQHPEFLRLEQLIGKQLV